MPPSSRTCSHMPRYAVVTNSSGFPHVASNSLVGAGGDHVFGTHALPHHLHEAVAHRRGEHVVLRLQIGARLHRAGAGHDPRLGVRQFEQRLVGRDQSAEPAAGGVVGNRVPAHRQHVAGDQHVRAAEEHVDVAVGVRLPEVAVLDPLPAPKVIAPDV